MMKKYLAWKQAELDSPQVACTASPAVPSPRSASFSIPGTTSAASPGASLTSLFASSSFSAPSPLHPTPTHTLSSNLADLRGVAGSRTSPVSSYEETNGAEPATNPILAGQRPNVNTPVIAIAPPDPSSILTAGSPGSAAIYTSGNSAFSIVSPPPPISVAASPLQYSPGVLSAALYPQLMCIPGLLDRLTPILRSQMANAAQFKPLPTSDTRVDPSRYKLREPREWTAQDVVSWMLDTSRRRQIPFEDVNMTKFAGLPGAILCNSTEADFVANDPVYGRVFYQEFQDVINGHGTAGDRALEEYMRKFREEELQQQPSTSTFAPTLGQTLQPNNPPLAAALDAIDQSVKMRMSQASLASTLSAALSPSMGLNSLQSQLSPQSPLLIQSLQNKVTNALQQLSPLTSADLLMNKYAQLAPPMGNTSTTNVDYDSDSDDSALHGVNDKIRKNKDGKPRKRSQHSKGNKLWEFIRDALKDPTTCPSIVRWEDPQEGVFRIVESERLARLWGERKNNQKMTYEKLSRAMRTYYEKQILVPVPKTGLYPKKLVYKFGPGATGWENCRGLAGIPPKIA